MAVLWLVSAMFFERRVNRVFQHLSDSQGGYRPALFITDFDTYRGEK
jgi:hypothetical protein